MLLYTEFRVLINKITFYIKLLPFSTQGLYEKGFCWFDQAKKRVRVGRISVRQVKEDKIGD